MRSTRCSRTCGMPRSCASRSLPRSHAGDVRFRWPPTQRHRDRANLLRESAGRPNGERLCSRQGVRRYEDKDVFAKHEERAMNKDQVKGSAKQVKGKVQQIAGKALGNKILEARGGANQVAGKTQRAYGDAKQMARKSVK